MYAHAYIIHAYTCIYTYTHIHTYTHTHITRTPNNKVKEYISYNNKKSSPKLPRHCYYSPSVFSVYCFCLIVDAIDFENAKANRMKQTNEKKTGEDERRFIYEGYEPK